MSSEVTAVRFLGSGKDNALLGTYGGTIVNWDTAANRSVSKLTGHLTSCSVIEVERNANRNVVVSGGFDTNVKLWDMRMKQSINTYKAHNQEITCLDISPDSKMAVSGSKDGTIKFWDISSHRMLHSLKISAAAHPVCL